MKFTVTLKDPDGFYDGVRAAAKESLKELSGLDEDEKADLTEVRHQKAWSRLEEFVSDQELITIEFDTVARTATVVPRSDITRKVNA